MKRPKKPAADDFAGRAEAYAYDVAKGKRPAVPLVQAAYKKWWNYRDEYGINAERLYRTCRLIQTMALPEGEATTFTLQDWQVALLSYIIAFDDKEGNRAITEFHLEIPRKAGKTSIAAAVLLSEIVDPRGAGTKPEVAIVGENIETTDICFEKARSILYSDELTGRKFTDRYKLRHTQHRITCQRTQGFICKLSAHARVLDGRTLTLAFVDEISKMPDIGPIGVIRSGLGHTKNALLFTATTPADDMPVSALDNVREVVKAWCEQQDNLSKFAGLFYEAPLESDPTDRKVWIAVQPSLDVIVAESWYKSEVDRCQNSEEDMVIFKTRQLCMPVLGGGVWISDDELTALEVLDEGEPVPTGHGWASYIGLDLSDIKDTSSVCLLSVNMRTGEQQARWKIFYPKGSVRLDNDEGEEKIIFSSKLHKYYADYAKQGYVELCPGRTINHERVANYVTELVNKYRVRGVVCDHYDAIAITRDVWPAHVDAILYKVGKGTAAMTAPAGTIATWIAGGTMRWDANPVVRQHFKNAVVKEAKTGGLLIQKAVENSKNKIDAVDALVNAAAAIHLAQEPKAQGTELAPIDNYEPPSEGDDDDELDDDANDGFVS